MASLAFSIAVSKSATACSSSFFLSSAKSNSSAQYSFFASSSACSTSSVATMSSIILMTFSNPTFFRTILFLCVVVCLFNLECSHHVINHLDDFFESDLLPIKRQSQQFQLSIPGTQLHELFQSSQRSCAQ